jgi:hypothetical protein
MGHSHRFCCPNEERIEGRTREPAPVHPGMPPREGLRLQKRIEAPAKHVVVAQRLSLFRARMVVRPHRDNIYHEG